jgi:hypothetical protein
MFNVIISLNVVFLMYNEETQKNKNNFPVINAGERATCE